MIHGRYWLERDGVVLAYLVAGLDALEATLGARHGLRGLPESVLLARQELRTLTTPPRPTPPPPLHPDPVCTNCGEPAERLRVGECEPCYRFRRRTGRNRRKFGDKRSESWGQVAP